MIDVYTIGHGQHQFAYFLGLLKQHDIEFVCDVRSFARSRIHFVSALPKTRKVELMQRVIRATRSRRRPGRSVRS